MSFAVQTGGNPIEWWVAVLGVAALLVLLYLSNRLVKGRRGLAAELSATIKSIRQLLNTHDIDRLVTAAETLRERTSALEETLVRVEGHQQRVEEQGRTQMLGTTAFGVAVGALTGHLVAAQFEDDPWLDRHWKWAPWPTFHSDTVLQWLSVGAVVLLACAATWLFLWAMHAYVDAKYSDGYRDLGLPARVRRVVAHLRWSRSRRRRTGPSPTTETAAKEATTL